MTPPPGQVRDARTHPVVDTHVHLVAADPDRYPFAPVALPGDSWYRACPVPVERMGELAADAGVDRCVLVQPVGAYGADNSYVVDAARTDPGRYAAVVCVDPTGPDPVGSLRALAAEPVVRGVRLFAVRADTPTIDDPAFAPLWAAAGELGLVVVATVLAPQLPGLATVLARHPDLTVALDHCGFAALDDPGLWALAAHPRLHLKVTSHVLHTVTASGGDPAGAVARLAAGFGPGRLMWGSDFAQTHDRPYAALVEAGRAACAQLDAAARDAVLGGTAARVFWG